MCWFGSSSGPATSPCACRVDRFNPANRRERLLPSVAGGTRNHLFGTVACTTILSLPSEMFHGILYRLQSDVHVLVRWQRAPSCRFRACGCQKQPGSERLTSATQNAACLPLFSALPSRKVLQHAAYTTPFDAQFDRNVPCGQGARSDHHQLQPWESVTKQIKQEAETIKSEH